MAYKDISDKSYVEIIAAVLVESGSKFVSKRDIYIGLCGKWTPFVDMPYIEWNSVIGRILLQNNCFMDNNDDRWRLHPACMELVKDGVYKADAMNNCAKMRCSSRDAALASATTKQSNKRFHPPPMEHQHPTKKMRLSVDATTIKPGDSTSIKQEEPSVSGSYAICKVENAAGIKPSVAIPVHCELEECAVQGSFRDNSTAPVQQQINDTLQHVDTKDEHIQISPEVINIEPVANFFDNYAACNVGEPADLHTSVDVHAACESEECPVHDNFRDNSIAAQVKQEIEDEQQHVDIKYEDILITNGIINITPITSFCATDSSYSSTADDDKEFKGLRPSNGQEDYGDYSCASGKIIMGSRNF